MKSEIDSVWDCKKPELRVAIKLIERHSQSYMFCNQQILLPGSVTWDGSKRDGFSFGLQMNDSFLIPWFCHAAVIEYYMRYL